jgi:hypothetical protein
MVWLVFDLNVVSGEAKLPLLYFFIDCFEFG